MQDRGHPILVFPLDPPAPIPTVRILEVKIPPSSQPTVLIVECAGEPEILRTVRVRSFAIVD